MSWVLLAGKPFAFLLQSSPAHLGLELTGSCTLFLYWDFPTKNHFYRLSEQTKPTLQLFCNSSTYWIKTSNVALSNFYQDEFVVFYLDFVFAQFQSHSDSTLLSQMFDTVSDLCSPLTSNIVKIIEVNDQLKLETYIRTSWLVGNIRDLRLRQML